MDITQDIYDSIPEVLQPNYIKTENGGYVSNESQQLAAMQTQFSDYESKYANLESKLNEFTLSKEQEIEAAKSAAYDKALAENDTSKLLEIEQQKVADAQARAEQYKTGFDSLRQDLANEKRDTIIESLSKYAKEDGEAALKRLLNSYVLVDPETNTEQYLNDDGTVSSLNREQFITEQLHKNPVFTSIVKGEMAAVTNGIANGSGSDTFTGGVPKSLEACKGDKKLEAIYFNAQMKA